MPPTRRASSRKAAAAPTSRPAPALPLKRRQMDRKPSSQTGVGQDEAVCEQRPDTIDDAVKHGTTAAASSCRDPITCHVLNTLSGTPAAGLTCHLTIESMRYDAPATDAAGQVEFPGDKYLPLVFEAVTDKDGRVSTWQRDSMPPACEEPAEAIATMQDFSEYLQREWQTPALRKHLRLHARLTVDGVSEFYEAQAVESFWPTVEVPFFVKGWEGAEGWRHYHVPVLLGPWSYSTYRGS